MSRHPELPERDRRILGALVQAYIDHGEPISSLWLASRGFGVSSATLRNVMSSPRGTSRLRLKIFRPNFQRYSDTVPMGQSHEQKAFFSSRLAATNTPKPDPICADKVWQHFLSGMIAGDILVDAVATGKPMKGITLPERKR